MPVQAAHGAGLRPSVDSIGPRAEALLGAWTEEVDKEFPEIVAALVHERSASEGPLFEKMRVQLEAVASQTGMTGIFTLQAVEICRVLQCRQVPADAPAHVPALAEVLVACVEGGASVSFLVPLSRERATSASRSPSGRLGNGTASPTCRESPWGR